MAELPEATVDVSPANPWEDGEAQRLDAEALEVPAPISERLEEVLLLVTERISIL